ncbi:MAG TPA: cupin domain-containing protein [Puia sp.]|nr:cupin domain-containing protein [Puia sp.]
MPCKYLLSALTILFTWYSIAAHAQTSTAPTSSVQPAAAQASAQTPIVRKQLMLAPFDPRPISKVDIREINLAPGQKGPLHKHPCPVVGYIVSGTIYFQVKGDSAIILKAGDPFYEPAGAVITHFDNASATAPAKFILNYLMNNEKQFIILLDDKEQEIKTPN